MNFHVIAYRISTTRADALFEKSFQDPLAERALAHVVESYGEFLEMLQSPRQHVAELYRRAMVTVGLSGAIIMVGYEAFENLVMVNAFTALGVALSPLFYSLIPLIPVIHTEFIGLPVLFALRRFILLKFFSARTMRDILNRSEQALSVEGRGEIIAGEAKNVRGALLFQTLVSRLYSDRYSPRPSSQAFISPAEETLRLLGYLLKRPKPVSDDAMNHLERQKNPEYNAILAIRKFASSATEVENEFVRKAAWSAWQKIKAPLPVDTFKRSMLVDPSSMVRAAAVRAAIEIGDRNYITVFGRALDDSDHWVRMYTLWGLGELGRRLGNWFYSATRFYTISKIWERLIDIARHSPSLDERAMAVAALGYLATAAERELLNEVYPRIRQTLQEAMQSPCASIRVRALRAYVHRAVVLQDKTITHKDLQTRLRAYAEAFPQDTQMRRYMVRVLRKLGADTCGIDYGRAQRRRVATQARAQGIVLRVIPTPETGVADGEGRAAVFDARDFFSSRYASPFNQGQIEHLGQPQGIDFERMGQQLEKLFSGKMIRYGMADWLNSTGGHGRYKPNASFRFVSPPVEAPLEVWLTEAEYRYVCQNQYKIFPDGVPVQVLK